MPNSVVNGSGAASRQPVKALRADLNRWWPGTNLRRRDRAGAQSLDSEQSGNRADQIVLLATLVLILCCC